MVYNFKEYKATFQTPAKREQEKVVATKIMDLLNKNKYDSLDELISRNQNYQDFLKNNHLENVVKHFGNTLTEEDFKVILNNLKDLTKRKQDFSKENIKTTNIDDKEYNSFRGENKTYFVDNSNSQKTIEEQMKDLQATQSTFQTSDMRQNTENMFKELEQNKKEGLNLRYLNEIDYSLLNNEERMLFQVANNYQQNFPGLIRIDLNKGIMVDEYDTIKKIEKENGEYVIKSDENGYQKEENANEYSKQHQKQLTLTPNTMYSSNSN